MSRHLPPIAGEAPAAEDYDGLTDFVRAREVGFAVIRERIAAGGPGWNPDVPSRTDRPVDIPQNLRRPPR